MVEERPNGEGGHQPSAGTRDPLSANEPIGERP
jgi:hypothetical protein